MRQLLKALLNEIESAISLSLLVISQNNRLWHHKTSFLNQVLIVKTNFHLKLQDKVEDAVNTFS